MQIQNSVALVTGAAGGLGQIFIRSLLARGASKVYAAVRPEDPAVDWPANVVPLMLDITNAAQVAAAAAVATDVTILVNNAGLNLNQRLLGADMPNAAFDEMNVNYFGTLAMCRAFAPALIAGQGAVINVLSVLARVSLPAMGSLCASKAAGLRLTDALRAELAEHRVQVLGVLPGVIDTAMGAGFPGPKALPQAVIDTVLDALEQGADEVYPDPMALDVAQRLASERDAVKAQFAAFIIPDKENHMVHYIDIPATDGTGTFKAYLAVPASGRGPGLVVGQEIFGINQNMRDVAQMYAEEGYVALVPDLFWRLQPGVDLGYTEADFKQALDLFTRLDLDRAVDDIGATMAVLRALPQVTGTAVGFVGFCMGGKLAYLTAARTDVACAVGYYGMGIEHHLEEANNIGGKLVLHCAGEDSYCDAAARAQIIPALAGVAKAEVYVYPGADHAFARVGSMHFDKSSAMMAHGRTIAALKSTIGPDFNLSFLWDEHVRHEFDTRNVPETMATMVAEPYVNHIPTLTGGVGQQQLSRFYQHHFVHANPADMRMIPISRTVGALQVVDEFIMCFTHDREIDWMLPGVAPTGKYVEIAMVGIISFRGDKLYHEHIYWDQASVLVQIGLLDGAKLPVAGIESAKKLLNENLPSNTLMARWETSAGL